MPKIIKDYVSIVSFYNNNRYGHEDAIKLLVDSGADMDAYNEQNFTPLHIALRQGCLEGVQQLLKCGQYVNQKGGTLLL